MDIFYKSIIDKIKAKVYSDAKNIKIKGLKLS